MVPVVFGRRSEASDRGVPRVNVVAIAVLLGSIVFGVVGSRASGSPMPLVVMVLVGVVLMQAPRIAQQWERAVVLRLGRFVRCFDASCGEPQSCAHANSVFLRSSLEASASCNAPGMTTSRIS
jgi:hypothetical protein